MVGRRRKPTDRGFTLVELLVVITILGILAAVVIAAVSGIGDKGEESARKTDASILATAEEASCAVENRRAYADTPQLRRNGFISAIGAYNDVDMFPHNGGAVCTAKDGTQTSYAIWTPEKTAYPVTVKGCNGLSDTFAAAPKKVAVREPWAFVRLLELGLDDKIFWTRGSAIQIQGTDVVPWVQRYMPPELDERAAKVIARSPGTGRPDFNDPAWLTSMGVDFLYGTDNDTLKPDALDTATSVSEREAQASFLTYRGFGGPDWALCPAMHQKEADGKQSPTETFENIYQDLRTLSVIFDVQQEAMDVIADAKERNGEALLRGNNALGDRVVKVAHVRGDRVGTGTGPIAEHAQGISNAWGNTRYQAIMASAGGTYPFGGELQVPSEGGFTQTDLITAAEVIAASPDVIYLEIDGTDPTLASWTTECNRVIGRIDGDPAWDNVPAVLNRRMVCVYTDIDLQSQIGGIEQLANMIAQV